MVRGFLVEIDLVGFHVDELVDGEEREAERDQDAAQHHAAHDDSDFHGFGQRHQFRNRLVQSVNGRQEECRCDDSRQNALCDAAAQERSHDEPFGCPYELHRVNQVAFREDRQPDRVVQQDERDDEQGSAEE